MALEKFLIEQHLQKISSRMNDSEIKSIKDNLPNKKFYEFMYYAFYNNHFNNLQKAWTDWKEWDAWDYPIQDLNRFNKIILQNKSSIEGKKVIDVGCSLGYLSLFCLHLGCELIEGTDVRPELLKVADFVCNKAGYKNYKFTINNVHEYESLKQVCQYYDTIIFSGVTYHIPDHYNVIKTLSDSNAGTLIIDNSEHEDFYQKSTPHVYWGKENIDEHQFYGYQDKEQKTIIVGKPNQSFINNLLTHFGWTLEKVNYYNLNNLKGPKTSSSRCCSTWIR